MNDGSTAPRKWRIRTKPSKLKKSESKKQNKMRRMAEKQFPLPDWLVQLLGALIVTLIVETLSRRSVAGAFRFIGTNPLAFLLNFSLIACTLAIALMFKRRLFTLALGGGIWIIMAVANFLVMSRRGRLALYPADLHSITDGIVVIPKLFTWWQVALIAGAVMLAVAGLIVLLLRTQMYRRDLNKGWLRLTTTALVFTVTLLICLENGFITKTLRPDFYAAYKKNGFSYSFVFGLFDTGMNAPVDYTDQAVQDIFDKTDPETEAGDQAFIPEPESGTNDMRLGLVTEGSSMEGYSETMVETIVGDRQGVIQDEDYPSIIILQLEAFCEPDKLSQYEFEGEPIPTFKRLRETCSGGILYVPTVAGGTCNTEFEVLTGCNLDLFGANEYPYYNLVRYNEFESLAHDLKPYGYTSTFLHNYSGTFYGRNLVYYNLGFDRFTSLEFMNGYDLTEKGWAKDTVLADYIIRSLDSTEGRDLIMAVGVQTHSAYPELDDEDAPFKVTASPEDSESDRLSFQYYLMEMNEVDTMLDDLIKQLEKRDEKVMLVVYGDHLPGITLSHDEMTTEELFSTSYVIWANYPMEKTDRDIESYQLSSIALEKCDIFNCGAMVTVHQSFMDYEPDSYLKKMSLVQYDITYGGHYWYGGKNIERQTEMTFGVEPVEVYSTRTDTAGNLFISGRGFTPDSEVYINGSSENTIYVNESLLIVQGETMGKDDTLEIRFYGADGLLIWALSYPEAVEEA